MHRYAFSTCYPAGLALLPDGRRPAQAGRLGRDRGPAAPGSEDRRRRRPAAARDRAELDQLRRERGRRGRVRDRTVGPRRAVRADARRRGRRQLAHPAPAAQRPVPPRARRHRPATGALRPGRSSTRCSGAARSSRNSGWRTGAGSRSRPGPFAPAACCGCCWSTRAEGRRRSSSPQSTSSPGPARIAFLKARSPRSKAGITLGGRVIGSDALWHGRQITTTVRAVHGFYTFTVQPYSAEIIRLGE